MVPRQSLNLIGIRSLRGVVTALLVGAATACSSSSSSTSITAPDSARCPVTLAMAPSSIEAGGGSGQITVSVSRDCTWEARSEADWVTLSMPVTGQGDGTIGYSVSPNQQVAARRGSVVVNESRVEVAQAAAACRFELSAPGASVGAEGGSLSVNVSAQATCAWTASTQTDWVTIDAGRDGSGSGTVRMRVEPNSGAPRTTVVTIAGQSYAITQAGAAPTPPGCTYTVAPPSEAFGVNGGEGTVRITASGPTCTWTAVASVPWISVLAGSGSGTGTARYVVAANTGAARSAVVSVAGASVTVTQAPAPQAPTCSFTAAPQGESFEAQGGDGSVRVTASDSSCAWTAVSNVPWIAVSTGSGSGNGTARYVVAANTGAARTGTVTVAGVAVSVTQAGAAAPSCTFDASPRAVTIAAAGSDATVQVTASATSCTWTATSQAPWITITAGSGSGNGTASFTVAANTGEARSGTVTVAGVAVTVSQAGVPPPCTFAISPQSASYNALGGTGAVRVDASAGNCAWTAASNVPWITMTTASGTGNGDARYLVLANLGAARSGTLTVAGGTVTVNQEAFVPTEVNLRGRLSGLSGTCPNLTFTVDGRQVFTDSGTDFDLRCDRIENGRDVRVSGLLQANGTVQATRVRDN